MDDARLALCEARGPLTDLFEKLSGKRGALWLERLSKTLRNEEICTFGGANLEGWLTYQPDDAFTAPGFDHFSLQGQYTRRCVVRLQRPGDIFTKEFLRENDPVEHDVPARDVFPYDLVTPALPLHLAALLGDTIELPICVAWYCLERQSTGMEKGPLLTNGKENIFFVRRAGRPLMTLTARWDKPYGSWYLNSRYLKSLQGWREGCRVFSGPLINKPGGAK